MSTPNKNNISNNDNNNDNNINVNIKESDDKYI